MNKLKDKVNIKKYLGEGFLIVFSVLFALIINKTYQDSKTNRYKNNAIKQIKTELLDNQNILNEWMADHNAILENLNKLIESNSGSIKTLAEKEGCLPIQIILDNKDLMGSPLSNSAWSSARSNGIISEFEFKKLQYISETYELQQLIMEMSIERIAERLFIKSSDIEHTKDILIELRLRFQNLRGQEYRLKQLYEETILILK